MSNSAQSELAREPAPANIPPMSFFVAVFSWFVIAAILATGIVLAVAKASFLLLILGALGFVFAFAKWGCASH